jgi:hypothetical protein
MQVAGTPEGVFWSQQGFRSAVAKTAGVPPSAVYWYRVRHGDLV